MSREFKIKLDLSPGGPPVLFNSLNQFEEWLKAEIDFWSWGDQELRKKDPAAWQGPNQIRKCLDGIKILVDALNGQSVSDHDWGRWNHDIINDLKQYKQSKILHSSTNTAQYVRKTAEEDEVLAGHILNAAIRHENPGAWNKFRGDVSYLLYDWNIKDRAKSEKAAIGKLKKEFSDHFNDSKAKLENLVSEHQNNKRKHEGQLSQQQQTYDELLKSKKEEFGAYDKELHERFDEIENFFRKKVALKSAMTYWGRKALFHNLWSIGLAFSLAAAFHFIGKEIYENIKGFIGEDTIETVKLWKLGLLGVGATIGVWVLRILVRLMLSNVHLGNDARERRTMLLTYLAMHKENELPDDQKIRSLILQALFRPSSSGIVKDDATPPFMAEWLRRTTGHDG